MTGDGGSSSIQIIQIPQEYGDGHLPSLSECASAYRAFRLQSLQLAPDAFASTYEREMQFSAQTWEDRLRNPLASTFVATVPGQKTPEAWVGMITMFGPTAAKDGPVSASASPWDSLPAVREETSGPGQPDAVWPFHLNAIFTVPAARGHGLGRRLIIHAIDHARDRAKREGVPRVKIGVFVDASNTAARRLYEKCGFAAVEETGIAPRLQTTAAGVEETQPERRVLILEQEIDIS